MAMLNEKILSDLYRSDTKNGKNFKAYCDHWINNPGSEYTNRGISLSLDQIFEFEVVKLYAEHLLTSDHSVGISGINRIEVEMDDKAC